MSVLVDATSAGPIATPGSSPYTTPHTLGAGIKDVMVLILLRDPSVPRTIASVVIGSDPLSFVAGTQVSRSTLQTEIWGGTTALSGAQVVAVTWASGDTTLMYVGVISALNADTVTPVNNGASDNNGGSPLPLAMTSASGDLTVTVTNNDGIDTTATDQNLFSLVFDYGPGTLNPTHTWSMGGFGWTNAVVSGANFKQAASVEDELETGRRFVSVP